MTANPQSPNIADLSTFRFLRRFSSIKVNYDRDRRKTVSRYQSQGLRVPSCAPVFFEDKKQVQKRLRASLEHYSSRELYVKIVCALFPNLKSREAPDSTALIQFLKRVFQLTDQEHNQLMDVARNTKLPQRIINLEVVEARDLPAKDTNGLSDPFCVLFLNTREIAQRTKIIHNTLTPVWKEYFKFKVSDCSKDVLFIEVMDYNKEEEPLRDRFRKLKEIKSPGTLGILIKEFANARSAQELIGSLRIPVSEISSETLERWFKIKNHEDKGEIYIRMALGYNKSKESATEEFFQIIHTLLVHELDNEATLGAPFSWDEHYEMWSKYILRQFKWQGALKPKDIVLTKWRAYTILNSIFPLNANMICLLLDAVLQKVLAGEYDGVEMTKFWVSTQLLIKTVITFLTELHDILQCPVTVLQTYHMLKTIELLNQFLNEPFPPNNVPPYTEASVIELVNNAVRDGADKFYIKVFSDSTHEACSEKEPMLTALERLIKMGQILHEDLRMGITTIHTDFKGILDIDYLQITYKVYDEQYGKIVNCIMEEYNSTIHEGSDGDLEEEENYDENDYSVKTVLAVLKLYLAVKNFTELAPKGYLNSKDISDHSLKKGFHDWFFQSVATWIDILRRKIMKWVKNSINIADGSESNNETGVTLSKTDMNDTREIPISSSAVDTAQMFLEMQKFWISLGWENPHQSYLIVRKILEELYGYLIYYGAQLRTSLKSDQGPIDAILEPDQINPYLYKACTSINNINYVKEQVDVLATQLNFSGIIKRISRESSTEELEEKIVLMKTEMQEQVETVIDEISQSCVNMIIPKYRKLLHEVTNSRGTNFGKSSSGSQRYQTLLDFVDNCLIILNENLEKGNFEVCLHKLWNSSIKEIHHNVTVGVESGKQTEYFKTYSDVLRCVHKLFWPMEIELKIENASLFEQYSETKKKLSYLKLSLEELKLEYFRSRYKRQVKASVPGNEHGIITVRTCYVQDKDTVGIEVLNARSLRGYDSNNLSDPYAMISIVPKELYPNISYFTTKTHKETLFPLFDEKFYFSISPDDLKKQGFVQITLYDYDFIGKDQFMGEVFIPLEKIKWVKQKEDLERQEQQNLVICKPDASEEEVIKRFEERGWDKEAVRFAKLEREKAK